jgi:outer membrane protein TolC
MYRVIVVFLLSAIVALLLPLVFAIVEPSPDTPSIDSDLGYVKAQIEAARVQEAAFAGGAIKALIQLRLSTLLNTEALLEQKKISSLRRIRLQYTIDGSPVAEATNDELNAILDEIREAEAKLQLSITNAERYSGGLIQVMALMTAETERISVAQLRLKFYSAKYGLLPALGGVTERQPKPSTPGRVVGDRDAF